MEVSLVIDPGKQLNIKPYWPLRGQLRPQLSEPMKLKLTRALSRAIGGDLSFLLESDMEGAYSEFRW